jgi:hypothetical protein
VRLASVRRSIFVEDPSRTQFLSHLMSGTKEILQTGQGLADHGNYHEFCRLLGRFKVNFQVGILLLKMKDEANFSCLFCVKDLLFVLSLCILLQNY